jgi:hypothetical protein
MSDDFRENGESLSLPKEEGDRGGWHLFVAWVIVSGLWIAATLLRVRRLLLQTEGWSAIISSRGFWIGLLFPPVMFAAVFLITYRRARRRP